MRIIHCFLWAAALFAADPAMERPRIILNPGPEYQDTGRKWQGIPGIERASNIDTDTVKRLVAAFAAHLRELGPANFIYADGDATFAHAHRRNQGGELGIRPPGLHLLCRRCTGEPGPKMAVGRTMAVRRPDARTTASASRLARP